jgi:hypothetical protein
LLRVKLLKTCDLWTSGNLQLDLLLLQNEPTDVGSYTRRQRRISIKWVYSSFNRNCLKEKVSVFLNNFIG